MTNKRSLARRVHFGDIIQPESTSDQSIPNDIVLSINHLHEVINALLKERSGQPLTDREKELIQMHLISKRWQLERGWISTGFNQGA